VSVAIGGVVDPDGDPVTITVLGVEQDEPVDGLADGSTCPDGAGQGTAVGRLRWERGAKGNGRTYHVQFRAEDNRSGSCEGTVEVCVPLHRSESCVADAGLVDSDGPPCAGTCPDLCDIGRNLAAAFCPGELLSAKVDRRILGARRAIERAARAPTIAGAKRLVMRSLQSLATARSRVAEAETAGTLSAGCAATLKDAFDATRTTANAWLAAN
jgi:hypothetical protein